MIKKYHMAFIFNIMAFLSFSFALAQPANYYMNPTFGVDGTFTDNSPAIGILNRTIEATSSNSDFYIEWDSQFNEWYNTSINLNEEFILTFQGQGGLNNTSSLNSNAVIGRYYTIQIEGRDYSNRNAVVMETSNFPIDISTVSSSVVAPNENEVITVTLSGAKSPEERVFIRYTDNNFTTSEVAEVTFGSPTGSSGTATIPASFNTSGKNVIYYAYSTTITATSSSNHDLISLRLGNNGGANFSYTVESNWETINPGNLSTASTWRANSVPPINQDLVIASNVSIDQDISANSIVCQSGNTLTINSGNTLTISSSDMTPQGISGDGSLIVNGTLSISEGGFTSIIPTYDAGSTLQYINITGTYNRFNEWNDGSILGLGVPDNVIVDNTVLDLTNSSQTTLTNFSINSNLSIINGGSLTVDENESIQIGGDLNNSGTLILNSTSTNYASLIVAGTATGNVNYNRHVNLAAGQGASTAANDLISPPVSGMSFGDLRSTNSNILSGTIGGGPLLFLFGPFDNSSVNNYELYEETVDDGEILESGIGYRTGSTDNGTYTFTGNLVTGSQNIAISAPVDGSIWNLRGNPYPSYLDVNQFLMLNNSQFDSSSNGIYGYDGTAADGWTIYNLITAPPGTLITPGQGFFVASQAGGGTITFNSGMRAIGDDDDFISGRPNSATTNIKLSLSNATETFNTDIYFTEFSSLGLDPGYDASLFGGSAPSFSIYSHLVEENNGVPFAIQALGKTDYGDTIVPLGVNANQGEQLIFKLIENTLPGTVDVYLDDNIENTSTLLNSNDYIITPLSNLSGTGRFYLRFSDPSLSINETDLDKIKIYANNDNKTITVLGLIDKDSTLKIFDIQGRLIVKSSLNSIDQIQTIDVNQFSPGVFIVQIENNSLLKTKKVILK